jgi:hypothetical protein
MVLQRCSACRVVYDPDERLDRCVVCGEPMGSPPEARAPEPRRPTIAERQALLSVLERATWDSATGRWTLVVNDAQYRLLLEAFGGYVEPSVERNEH